MDRRLLDIKIQLEQCITEREGMIAENMQREALGESMAYTSKDFDRVIVGMEYLLNVVRDL